MAFLCESQDNLFSSQQTGDSDSDNINVSDNASDIDSYNNCDNAVKVTSVATIIVSMTVTVTVILKIILKVPVMVILAVTATMNENMTLKSCILETLNCLMCADVAPMPR